MSWKSLITAGLLCVLATPAFAVGPTMSVTKAGTFANNYLDVNGNWVWSVNITPDYSLVPDASGTPVAAELGITSNTSVSTAAQGAGFDTLNPGKQIFTFESNAGCNANGNPCGIQVNPTGNKQIFAAIGSSNATSGALEFLKITAAGPNTATTTASTLTVSGAYGGNGRIAQINGGTVGPPATYTTGAFDTFNGVFSHTAHAGDANLDGNVDGLDLGIIAANFNGTGKKWYQGDYNGDGNVDGLDLGIIAANFNFTGPPPGAGSGGGLGSSSVPEPASVAMIGLGLLGGLGVIRRKR